MTPQEALLIDVARDLVALWKNLKIKGLLRSERNEAIDDTRLRLVNAVAELGARPYTDDLVESVTRAMINCHSRKEHHASYVDWVQLEEKVDEPNQYDGENAREWMAARRLEAKAAIVTIRSKIGG